MEPASRIIAHGAAVLRAEHGRSLRLPDALVLATAHALMASVVLTTDGGWPEVGVNVQVVGPDLLTADTPSSDLDATDPEV